MASPPAAWEHHHHLVLSQMWSELALVWMEVWKPCIAWGSEPPRTTFPTQLAALLEVRAPSGARRESQRKKSPEGERQLFEFLANRMVSGES